METTRFCNQCGNKVRPGDSYCQGCGSQITTAAGSPSGGGRQLKPSIAVGVLGALVFLFGLTRQDSRLSALLLIVGGYLIYCGLFEFMNTPDSKSTAIPKSQDSSGREGE